MKKKTIKRIPRPQSLTTLLRVYNKTKDKDTFKRILNLLISNLTQGTLYHTVRGQIEVMSVQDLSQVLGISSDRLIKEIARKYEGLMEDKDFQGYSRAILSGIFKNGLRDRYKAEAWALELQAVTRKRGYQALLVKETNSAFTGTQQANLNLLKIIGSVQPKQAQSPTLNINNNNQIHTTENHTILTPDMAVKLITEQGHTGLNPDNRQVLYLENGLEDMPEVRATFQDVKAYEGHEIPDDSHLERRAKEYNIVPEER